MLLRWLLPIVAVFALLGNAVTAFAAAGVWGDDSCCCPSKKVCKCDHDKPVSNTEVKRCASKGEATKIVPSLSVMTEPSMGHELVAPTRALVIEHAELPIPDDFIEHPETPPF